MSLSRSPSPALGGGWSSPGLHTPSGPSSPASGILTPGGSSQMWDSSRLGVSPTTTSSNGYATSKGRSFLGRMRKLSTSLPRFRPGPETYTEKDKPGRIEDFRVARGFRSIAGRVSRKLKLRLLFVLVMSLLVVLWYTTRTSLPLRNDCFHSRRGCAYTNPVAALHYYWRRSPSLGGGKKFVMILGANVGGGVMNWKGAREWAIERDSVRNKKKYAAKWGYELEIVDMRKKKKYAHEWREGWQKVDYIRSTMRKYPDAEWYASPHVPLCQASRGISWFLLTACTLQVLVARPQHVRHGADILPPGPYLQRH